MPRSIKETDGGGDPSSGDEDGVPVDPPTLPPSMFLSTLSTKRARPL